MLSIPLPHVVALFLVAVLVLLYRSGELFRRENRPFSILILAYTLQSVLVGLRWGYGIFAVLPFQAVMAALMPGLAWIAFSSLAREDPGLKPIHILPHLVPALVLSCLVVFWQDPIDVFVIAVFLIYGLSLLWLIRRGEDSLLASRLDGALRSYRAVQITGLALLFSAFSDMAISFDQLWNGGRYSPVVIATGNILALLFLGFAAYAASSDRSEGTESEREKAPLEATGEDAEIAAAVDALMRASGLYKDMDLNLGKLARRLRQPARAVSGAINRVHGASVSQYVNHFRVEEACRLLETTEETITSIMFASGFMTKSNFNREFQRVTGSTPSTWRRQRQNPG